MFASLCVRLDRPRRVAFLLASQAEVRSSSEVPPLYFWSTNCPDYTLPAKSSQITQCENRAFVSRYT